MPETGVAYGCAEPTFGGQLMTGSDGEPQSKLLTVDPQPEFDLSPHLFMQFMEPLGTTDGSGRVPGFLLPLGGGCWSERQSRAHGQSVLGGNGDESGGHS